MDGMIGPPIQGLDGRLILINDTCLMLIRRLVLLDIRQLLLRTLALDFALLRSRPRPVKIELTERLIEFTTCVIAVL